MTRPSPRSFFPAVPRLLFFLSVISVLSVVNPCFAHDWLQSRGPINTGVAFEKDLPDKFDPATGENIIWKAPYPGRTTPVVMNGRVYIIQGFNATGQKVTEQERVLCLDEKDGKLLHEYRFGVFLTDIVSDRLGWTNLAADPETGNIYAHGTGGLLIALDKDLKPLWQHSLTEEYGRVSGYGGRVVSPIVDEDKVIVGMANASWGDFARGGTRFVAFDKKTGEVIWWANTGLPIKDTNFSTPVIAVVNGERLMIAGGGDGGVHAVKARTGEKVWSYVFCTGAVNPTAVVQGNKVWIAHGYTNPESGATEKGRVICLDAGEVKDGKPKLVWQVDGIEARFASPLLHDDRLYVCDVNARMFCLDANTGKKLWKRPHVYGRNSMGSPVWADGKIFVNPVQTDFIVLKDDGAKATVLHDQFFPSPDNSTVDVELNGSPTVANGKIFFLTSLEFFCVGKKGSTAKADPIPPQPQEKAGDGKAVKAAVFPADVDLNPGESKQLSVRLLDAQGHVVKETKEATWKPAPPPLPPAAPVPPGSTAPPPATPPALQGEVTKDGKLTVAKAPPGQFGSVVAEVDGLTASARVRVAPTLPYKPDFSKIPAAPGGWVNTQGKFAVKEVGGKKVLAKLANNPNILVARATAYIGKPTLSNYTIQADVLGKKVRDDQADAGVVNSRYTLMLDGNKQQLRLYSWDALPRVDKTIGWAWKPDVWYTLKLTVEVKGDKATVRGKVWPREQSEPKDWTVEFEDPLPNKEGAPGLYGFATGVTSAEDPGAEIYYDNVSVTPNK
jgi:outer membrane protein assembly factor BamB